MGLRIDFEGLLVVADGGVVHVLVLALPAQYGVFGRQALQQGVGGVDMGPEGGYLLPLGIDNAELAADIAADVGLLDVVARVDGLVELGEEPVEVALVEGSDGIAVLAVGLALLEGLGYEQLVVVAVGKLHHLGPHEDVALPEGRLQRDALERTAARERHVGLAAGKGPAPTEVDGHLREGESLALMHGDGPGQSQRELGIGAQQLLLDLLLLVVEGVAHVLPHLALYVELVALLVDDAHDAQLLVDILNGAQRAVHPALVLVVLDEDDLCARLQQQLLGRGQRRLGEVALDGALEQRGLPGQRGQALLVGEIDDVAARGEGDGEGVTGVEGRRHPRVQGPEVGIAGGVGTDTVED